MECRYDFDILAYIDLNRASKRVQQIEGEGARSRSREGMVVGGGVRDKPDLINDKCQNFH